MENTLGYRLNLVLSKMNWSQDELALAMGITQPAVSKMIKEGQKIKLKSAQLLHEATGFNMKWLMTGQGNMDGPDSSLSEPDSIYETTDKYSKEARQKRFSYAIDVFKGDRDYIEAASELSLDYSHVSGVRNGHKDVSIEMLVKCIRYGKMNANFILAGSEPVMLTGQSNSTLREKESEITDLKARIQSLEIDKRNLQMLVDLIPSPVKKTG